MDQIEMNEIVDERYKEIARNLHKIFSTKDGEKAMAGLEQLFTCGYFDSNHPNERALYQQGQTSVIYEIKDMIFKVEKGFFK